MSAIPINIADHVGRTPLVQLTRLLPDDAADGVQVFGKLESRNPGGSVKDRIGVSMLAPGWTLTDIDCGDADVSVEGSTVTITLGEGDSVGGPSRKIEARGRAPRGS